MVMISRSKNIGTQEGETNIKKEKQANQSMANSMCCFFYDLEPK